MKLAYVIFDGITWLDFIGVYDPVSRLKSMKFLNHLSWDVCAFGNSAKDVLGLEIFPTKIKRTLVGYDAIIIPGGLGTRLLQFDDEFLSWLKTAKDVKYKIAVCTGSLLLGAAGFLKDKSATTHFAEYETLENYCSKVVKERIVEDGDTITAGAVCASIDLGLYLCEKWAGKENALEIRKKMDYRG